ncbi:MAG: hypothetical protein ACRD2T_13605 [Thermoanaerobaculia bacterium]
MINDKVGFLTIVECGENSWAGGYLVTDLRGNPADGKSAFCYTQKAVTLSRLQVILLGKALKRYVFCDLIAKTLLAESVTQVSAVLCDRVEGCHLRELVDIPVGAWVEGKLLPHERYRQKDDPVLNSVRERLDLIDGPLEVFVRVREAMRFAQANGGLPPPSRE